MSELSRRTTPERISIVAWTSSREAVEVVVVVAELDEPVIVSPEVKVPVGTESVMEVEAGFVRREAVAALVLPVMVSAIVKLSLSLTERVIVPTG
jgi:hypothetical protein|tara:strand:- start:241 stop:525 length:285 start_codon:yes stop_codon:yes gene_type:complete